MIFKQIAILGANELSISLALKLKTQRQAPQVIGYDERNVIVELAQAHGAFDRIARRPEEAVEGSDLVIIALPLMAMRESFQAIAPYLKPGAVVTDLARLKGPVLAWATELLPEGTYFIGGHLVFNPILVGPDPMATLEEASADWLEEALYCIVPSDAVPEVVLDAFAAWVRDLDAQPYFIDVTEHDGLQASVEGLPDVLSVALLRTTVNAPGWPEVRKFADRRFALATEAAHDAQERHAAVYLNRAQVLHRVNLLIQELVHIRDLLNREDQAGLADLFTTAANGREQWLAERAHGLWVQESASDMSDVPSLGQQLKRLLLGERPSWQKRQDEEQ